MIKEERRWISPADDGTVVMEGMISFRAVLAGIEAGITDRKIIKVLYDAERKKALARPLSYVRAMSFQHGFALEETDATAIEALSIGHSHGGLLTLVSRRTMPPLDALVPCEKGFYVMLNGIEDPYNFGYALRSLYAAGADGVILNQRNWMNASGVVCRASAGASERMPLYEAKSDGEAVGFFAKAGFRILASDTKNALPLGEANLKKPLLLAVGGEKRGLSETVLKAADERIRIPYGRPFEEALSAASAAAVLAFFVLEANR